ncbi:ubiquinol-cytochrome-c reductase complex assembly factor 2-like isoform X2 [Diaphorina citri]|uniref:Mitochondrial nucleoid factor 1 n=1 Tax=Diaphorina citri TaxID=121845 RepID=A0A1S4EDR0_DIACI|nr:ubiquinol-cytochrome-c reductase complex assembly factor 2-like isoform X1 [Diaphorina citri]XP_026680857.1 ubiquinol-cytochrome-c reductase complex assembly factor 2-like isoform X2 [Diaphorina citri]
MASRLYKEYLKLFEHWPLDITKRGGRDFAEYLRELTRAQFVSNNKFTIEEEETLKKNLASLKRLSEDIYNKKYPRTFQTSASGLNGKECNTLLSQEFLDAMREDSKGMFSKLFKRKDKYKKDQ